MIKLENQLTERFPNVKEQVKKPNQYNEKKYDESNMSLFDLHIFQPTLPYKILPIQGNFCVFMVMISPFAHKTNYVRIILINIISFVKHLIFPFL